LRIQVTKFNRFCLAGINFSHMIFFVIFSIINCLAAADLARWEGIAGSLSPCPKTNTIFNQAKEDILSFYHSEFRHKGNARQVCKFYHRFEESLDRLGNCLETEDLLKALFVDDSYQLLAIVWFSFRSFRQLLAFNHINDLFFPRNPLSPTNLLEPILDNFKIVLSQTVAELKAPCCVELKDSAVGFRVLEIFNIFWHNKLERLGGRMLEPEEFKKWKMLIEERLSFLDTFLTIDLQILLVQEYRKLHQETTNGIDKTTISIRNFCFLVKHFGTHLTNILSCDFLANFEWLASRSALFLIYFFYFWEHSYKDEYPDEPLLTTNIEMMKYAVKVSLNLGASLIFGNLVTESSEENKKILWLANRIIAKTENPIENFPKNKSYF
jgi:hypothetical protein